MLIPARLTFADDGTPLAETCGDVCHPAHDGAAQSRHIFLGGNDLPQRWRDRERFVILETGFGLGLDFLTTWQAWRDDPQRSTRLHFVSVEEHPFSAADLAIAQRAWPAFAALAAELQAAWPPLAPGVHRLALDGGAVVLTLVFGDAQQLRTVNAAVDAFFLDGFSPDIARALARLAAPGATLATRSATDEVGQALADAEFDVEQRPGFADQPPLLRGRFRSRRPQRHMPPDERSAVVIGAGIAGSTVAHRLAAAGWRVTVLEREADAGLAASGNLAGVLRPLPSADDNRLSRLTRAGFLATRQLLQALPDARWAPCGVFHLARDAEHERQQKRAVEQLGLPEDLLQYVDAGQAAARLGYPVDAGGWWFPSGGWVQPFSVCRAALAAFPERIDFRRNSTVDRIERQENLWQALAADGTPLAAAPVLIMACGADLGRFPDFAGLPQKAARGQVTHIPAAQAPNLDVVYCRHGYVAPVVDGYGLSGATLQAGDADPAERLADHVENLGRLMQSLPGYVPPDAATLSGKVGFRPMSPDRLPIVGPVPVPGAHGRPAQQKRVPGLWCALGYGARGIVWSALMADLLVSRLEGEPLPLESDLVDAVDPGRFLR